MPHVAEYLAPDKAMPTGRFWRLQNDIGQRLQTDKIRPTGRFWRLQNDIGQRLQTDKIRWKLCCGEANTPIPFVLGGDFLLHLALFRHGVGFITVSACPESDILDDWLAFFHEFRFMRNRDGIKICADREHFDPTTRQKSRRAFRPLSTDTSAPDGSFQFMDIIEDILKASGLSQRAVFTPGHTLPFGSLFVQAADEAGKAHTLYRMRNFFSPKQGARPSGDDLSLNHPSQFAYAGDQYFIQTLDGGSFVAFEKDGDPVDEFNRTVLPGHLRGVYFCANLLALYQRFALSVFSERVAEIAAKGPDKEAEKSSWADLKTLLNDFLNFGALGYFRQAMQSDHHHRYYRKWQDVLQIQQLFDEVRCEIRDLYEQEVMRLRQLDDEREKAEEQRESRFEKTLTILGALFVVPSLLLSFLGINLRGVTSGEGEGLGVVLVALLVCGSVAGGGLLLWCLTRWHRPDNEKGPRLAKSDRGTDQLSRNP
jgi:hypothetical protein